jgi:excisionase family DNA binding protein
MATALSQKYVTPREAALILGVTVGRVRQLRRSNLLPAEPIDGRTFAFHRAEVLARARSLSGKYGKN